MAARAQKEPWYEQVDWAAVGEGLVAYTVWLLRHRRWAQGRSDNIGLGQAAEDIASEAMADVICGRCNFEYHPSKIGAYLRQRVRWKLGHLGEAAARRAESAARPEDLNGGPPRAANRYPGARERLERLRGLVADYMARRRRKFDLLVVLDAVCELGGDVDGLCKRLDLKRDQVYYQLRVLRQLAMELDDQEVEDEK